MGKTKLVPMFLAVGAVSLCCAAQILPVSQVEDPSARLLQRKYSSQLEQIAADTMKIHFPYHFYLNPALDVDEARQKQLPQGSIHFDRFEDQIVLEMTGNYYVSYSAPAVNANQRARQTFKDVVFPLLRVATTHVDRTIPFDGYAFEIAHHVRAKVMGINTENSENLMLLIPRNVAERLMQNSDMETQQAALLESKIYLNGQPLALWLAGDEAPAEVKDHYLAAYKRAADPPPAPEPETGTKLTVNPRLLGEPRFPPLGTKPPRNPEEDTSPGRMARLQITYQSTLDKLVHDLNEQARFVAYAPPNFVPFHEGAYLQLNMSTELSPPAGPSQYRIAALAFDGQVAHVLRAVSKYFHDNPQFEGIDFSTTVHQEVQPNAESVEFIVPFSALVCYEKYDCTGQELINRSMVLVNGERVTLDLERAESDYNAGLR